MILLPLLLRVFPVPRRFRAAAPVPPAPPVLPRLIDGLAGFNIRHRLLITVVSGLLVAASLAGWWTIRVNTDQLDFYPEGAPLRQRAEDLRRSLTGFGAFYVAVDSGQPGGVTEPGVLRAIVGLQDFLGSQSEVDRTVGVTDYLRQMHREMNGGEVAFETIPPTREQVAQYLLLMEGPELARYIDFDASAASLLVRHHITGTWQLADLLRRLDAYVAAHFPAGVSVQVTGRAVLLRNAADSLAVNELVSLSTTFVMIGVIHSLFFKSLRVGLLSLLPNAVPVLLIYGLMGLLGIPLDLATAMIATLAIGIAVDDTVHHVVSYRRELRTHRDRKVAMFNTLHKQARPILYVSLALAAGFFVFGLSRFAPLIHFGILSGLVMLIALLGELVLTPVVMYTTAPFTAPWRRAAGGAAEPSATAPHP
jgi:predicted RND superfamily exporter protein